MARNAIQQLAERIGYRAFFYGDSVEPSILLNDNDKTPVNRSQLKAEILRMDNHVKIASAMLETGLSATRSNVAYVMSYLGIHIENVPASRKVVKHKK